MFSYKGVDSNFNYKVGTVKANNTKEAIEIIKQKEDILIIVNLSRASKNKTINKFQSNIRQRVTSIENKFKNRRKRKDKKSSTIKSKKKKEREENKTLAEKSPILRVINKVVNRDEEENLDYMGELEVYSEIGHIHKENNDKIQSLNSSKKNDNKGKKINWDLLDTDELSEEVKQNNKLKVKPKDVLMFTRKLQIMLSSGVPLLTSLSLLRDMENKGMGIVLHGVLEDIKLGNSLSEAIAKYPKIFNASYVSLISIGETSGNLDEALIDIIRMKEQEQKVAKKVKTASIYPAIIGVVLSIMMIAMSTFFLPKFGELYEDQDLATPLFTKVVFWFSGLIPYVLIGIVILVLLIIYLRKKIPKVNQTYYGIRDKLLLRIPIVKGVTNALYMYTFSYTVSLMLKNGIRLSDTLTLAGRSINNIYLKSEVESVSELMSYGLSFSEALREQPHFDDILVNITLTGEESGQMVGSLTKVAQYYDDELNNRVDAMMEVIPPTSIVLISAIAAPVVIAAYLPILEISSGAGVADW